MTHKIKICGLFGWCLLFLGAFCVAEEISIKERNIHSLLESARDHLNQAGIEVEKLFIINRKAEGFALPCLNIQ